MPNKVENITTSRSMMKKTAFFSLLLHTVSAQALPQGFVYLHEINGSILQDMRYAQSHNFTGRKIKGYQAGKCILTKEAALALSHIQRELVQSSLTLKVYDCYRPQVAVQDMLKWHTSGKQEMRKEFYPNTNKSDLFKLGFIAKESGHTRGSTVDLTIVALPYLPQPRYRPGEELKPCTEPYLKRFRDNSIDMGTGFDCFDETAHTFNPDINTVATQHRILLRSMMMKHGFQPYNKEWWHFTLKNEPYPQTYFNFVVK